MQRKHGVKQRSLTTNPSLVELEDKIGIVHVAVSADNHVLSPLVFDVRDDLLIDILIKFIWDLLGSINPHKHALHLDNDAVRDSLAPYLCTGPLNRHLRLLRLEMHGRSS